MTTELWRGWAFGGLVELGYALELLLGAITVLMGCIGVFLCLAGANGSFENALIGREYNAKSENRPIIEMAPSLKAGQVTIRLEPGYFRLFRRHRCVVTIRGALEEAGDSDQEVW
jgi:hypothetical protein